MEISRFLKNGKTLCVYFEESEREDLCSALEKLGYPVSGYFESPAIIHPDKNITFIRSFASAMLFHLPKEDFKKARPEIIRIDYKKLSGGDIKSGWYETRNHIT